ncbi:hypothetical protein HNO88_000523 [Novosphingobium chloroacetimidivorans]|uniref:DUF4747 family protein n=1 Tax=Novosphingobium chloroacetimidivorans TaxID=1428314 RepID=A0A7W7K6R7_9SPHN|nr:DUF4747 family protein [Novosphingobium chloroacetimidivorans]MBB4857216.1 hypothetical protein [Novosphingobium chloroacetimidivorans]
MAETLEVGFLNIVATPHPKGVYRRLLTAAAEHPVDFWGAYKAAITKPISLHEDDTFHTFQLIVWMEINPDEPAIDKAKLKKAAFPTQGREFTATYGVNGRVFYCIFDEKTHQLTFEARNEDRQTISPTRVGKIFSELLSPKVLGVDAELVEVTVVPTDDAITYVLGLARLDKVEILVKRPNQDDITTETNRVMKDLIEQNARSERREITRQAKTDGIELSEENETYARVAAHNGYVNSSGLDENEVHARRSTREVPKIVKRAIAQGVTYLAALRSLAREARDNREQL